MKNFHLNHIVTTTRILLTRKKCSANESAIDVQLPLLTGWVNSQHLMISQMPMRAFIQCDIIFSHCSCRSPTDTISQQDNTSQSKVEYCFLGISLSWAACTPDISPVENLRWHLHHSIHGGEKHIQWPYLDEDGLVSINMPLTCLCQLVPTSCHSPGRWSEI